MFPALSAILTICGGVFFVAGIYLFMACLDFSFLFFLKKLTQFFILSFFHIFFCTIFSDASSSEDRLTLKDTTMSLVLILIVGIMAFIVGIIGLVFSALLSTPSILDKKKSKDLKNRLLTLQERFVQKMKASREKELFIKTRRPPLSSNVPAALALNDKAVDIILTPSAPPQSLKVKGAAEAVLAKAKLGTDTDLAVMGTLKAQTFHSKASQSQKNSFVDKHSSYNSNENKNNSSSFFNFSNPNVPIPSPYLIKNLQRISTTTPTGKAAVYSPMMPQEITNTSELNSAESTCLPQLFLSPEEQVKANNYNAITDANPENPPPPSSVDLHPSPASIAESKRADPLIRFQRRLRIYDNAEIVTEGENEPRNNLDSLEDLEKENKTGRSDDKNTTTFETDEDVEEELTAEIEKKLTLEMEKESELLAQQNKFTWSGFFRGLIGSITKTFSGGGTVKEKKKSNEKEEKEGEEGDNMGDEEEDENNGDEKKDDNDDVKEENLNDVKLSKKQEKELAKRMEEREKNEKEKEEELALLQMVWKNEQQDAQWAVGESLSDVPVIQGQAPRLIFVLLLVMISLVVLIATIHFMSAYNENVSKGIEDYVEKNKLYARQAIYMRDCFFNGTTIGSSIDDYPHEPTSGDIEWLETMLNARVRSDFLIVGLFGIFTVLSCVLLIVFEIGLLLTRGGRETKSEGRREKMVQAYTHAEEASSTTRFEQSMILSKVDAQVVKEENMTKKARAKVKAKKRLAMIDNLEVVKRVNERLRMEEEAERTGVYSTVMVVQAEDLDNKKKGKKGSKGNGKADDNDELTREEKEEELARLIEAEEDAEENIFSRANEDARLVADAVLSDILTDRDELTKEAEELKLRLRKMRSIEQSLLSEQKKSKEEIIKKREEDSQEKSVDQKNGEGKGSIDS